VPHSRGDARAHQNGLLSAAVLLSQVALIRVFSVAQFYHFAFLVTSRRAV
jgi:hypothetical protein